MSFFLIDRFVVSYTNIEAKRREKWQFSSPKFTGFLQKWYQLVLEATEMLNRHKKYFFAQLKVKKEGASSSVWNMDKVKSVSMVGLLENFTSLQTYHGGNINLKKE